MKNILSFLLLILFANISFAQSLDDALRYSQSDLSGTARYVSMGGAFGALGGDLSSIADNPASTGVFMFSEVNITPSLYHSNNNTSFLGNSTTDNKSNFNINNFAFVGSFNIKDQTSDWKSINYAFTYKRLDNYHQNIYAEGQNTQNSITDYFADKAEGTRLGDIRYNFDASYLGDNAYDTYLINPDNDVVDNTSYHSSYDSFGQTQIHSMSTEGRKDIRSFSIGANYDNKLYIGASLDYSSIEYSFASTFREQDDQASIDDFTKMQYKEEFSTSGFGYAFKVGLIYRPLKWLRLAYSFHTPINYNLTDTYSHSIESWGIPDVDGIKGYQSAVSTIGVYDYNIITPLKMMGALGIVINKKAIIGLEYEYLDYSTSKIRSIDSGDEFTQTNLMINDSLKLAHNVKIGFEYRLGNLSLRTGVSYFDSPYRTKETNENAYTIYYNAGIGFNYDYYYLDFAYSLGQSNYNQYAYQTSFSETEPYDITQTTQKLMVTFGLRF